jgi:hypothetical protein
MGLVAVIRRADGGISTAAIVRDRAEGETEKEFEDACYARMEALHAGSVRVGLFQAEQLPERDEFRNAWRAERDAVTIDIDAAKEIKKAHLRAQRDPLLKALDVEMLRAIEAGDARAQAQITEKKQVLRDITALPEIESARDVDVLRDAGKEVLSRIAEEVIGGRA